jgi:hypothetical protein
MGRAPQIERREALIELSLEFKFFQRFAPPAPTPPLPQKSRCPVAIAKMDDALAVGLPPGDERFLGGFTSDRNSGLLQLFTIRV